MNNVVSQHAIAKPANSTNFNSIFLTIFSLMIFAFTLNSAHASDRVALLIANEDYERGELKNPINDAVLLEKKLSNLDYDITVVKNADRIMMLEAIGEFGLKAKGADSAVFYYSGHGMQDDSRVNYLLPVNAKISSEASIKGYGVEAYEVISALDKAKPRVSLVMFDACRDNPFAGVRGSRNFVVQPYEANTEMLVSYATKTGQYAIDGDGNNSPYVIALAEQLDNASTTPLLLMFDHVSDRVKTLTNHQQSPTRMGDVKVSTFLVPSNQTAYSYSRPLTTTTSITKPSFLEKTNSTEPNSVRGVEASNATISTTLRTLKIPN